ncbi:cyclin-dependent kinase inhibitor 7 [Ziziphus jujuba]|uniref:Cyclin-dependent kinase inhibitor 7 n=1 Tax=Ziziphus jujuba TaxID=326968 RepID=A0A6P4A9T2_ZIZJJ|nr:cyclin-dependent kinase inhibitor 7 [Ziziphus jujuba]
MEGKLAESKRIAETAEATTTPAGMVSKRRKVVCSRQYLHSPPSPLRLDSPTKLDCMPTSAAGDFSSNVCLDHSGICCRCFNNAANDDDVDESFKRVDLEEVPNSETVRAKSIEDNEIREQEPSDEPSADTVEPETAGVPTAALAVENDRNEPPARILPTIQEIEEFFAKAESYEQTHFTEKYNFDFVNDVPLEGRYEWLPLKP